VLRAKNPAERGKHLGAFAGKAFHAAFDNARQKRLSLTGQTERQTTAITLATLCGNKTSFGQVFYQSSRHVMMNKQVLRDERHVYLSSISKSFQHQE